MNKLPLILVIVGVLIVGLVIGDIGYSEFYQHTTKLNNYTGNGVSFEYPADYNITESNSTVENFSNFNATKLEIPPAFLIATNTKNPNLTFQVSKSPVNGTVYHGVSLDEYFNSVTNDLKSRGWYIDADNTTRSVDNTSEKVRTYIINYNEKLRSGADSVNGEIMIFDMNGIRYRIDFQGKGKQNYDDRAFITVINSFKVLPGN